jgi:parallel beta-helix repeat protein
MLIVLLVVTLSIGSVGYETHLNAVDNIITNHPADESIRIHNNAGLAALASNGVGSELDPYFIANLQLAVTDEEVAIDISNTDAHFILKNCRIVVVRGLFALILSNVSNGVVEECEVVGGSLFLDFSNCCEIIDNTIIGPSSETGIDILFCRDVMISGNTVSDAITGIFLLGSKDIWVSSNHIYDNKDVGVDIYLSENTTMIDNVLENNGVFLSLWSAGTMDYTYEGSQFIDVPYNFDNNTVNGKPLGFFHEVMNTDIPAVNFGQVILLNCTDVKVYGGYFTNTSVGFQTHYSRNCSLEDSTIANNTSWGMYIFNSNFTEVKGCEIQNNERSGIHLEHSNHALIEENTVSDNLGSGIYLQYSNNCSISNNSLLRNSYGTSFYASKNNSVIDNVISFNTLFGVRIGDGSEQNRIYGNDIGWNIVANAHDGSGNNFWDNGIDEGNRWSDYLGFGVYEIDYYGIDNYPSSFGNSILNPLTLAIIGISSTALVGVVIAVILQRKRG